MHKWRNGSFTVEAALLVPLLVYLMIAMLYMDFWLFDQVAAQGLCCQATWQIHSSEETDVQEMEARLEMTLKRAMLSGQVIETDCTVNDLYSRTECRIGMEIPLRSVRWVLGSDSGYESTHTTTVSGLASMTVFRRLCAAEAESGTAKKATGRFERKEEFKRECIIK